MKEKISIRLISQLKTKDSDTSIQKILKGGLTIIILPFIFLFGFLIMSFALIISIFQKRDIKISDQLTEEPWTILTEINGIKVWKKYKGEIRFGPMYYDFKTDPTISGFDNEIFGDWFYHHRQGLFLQQWSNTKNPNASLIYLDTVNRKLINVKESINSVLWDIELKDKQLELNCNTGEKILKYEIRIP